MARNWRWTGLGLALLGLLIIVFALTGWAIVTLAGCVVAGVGITYLSGLPLTLEERLAYGTVVGAMAVALADLLLAWALGVNLLTTLGGVVVALLVSWPGWRRASGTLRLDLAEAAERWRRAEPWPLWALLAICWPFTLVLLGGSYRYTGQGLITGNAGAYADWAAHLTYAGSFVYAHNFPPQFPIDPGHRLAYPFMIDLLAASLVPLGTSLTSSLVLTSGLLALAFPAVMYLAALRFVGRRDAAAVSVLVFTLSGGLGFLSLAQDFPSHGWNAVFHSAHWFTQNSDQNLQWLSPVLAWLVPQRSVLFGYSLALLVMAMLWMALRSDVDAMADADVDRRPFVFAGVVTGLTPLFHLHAYGTIVALAVFWALFAQRPQWAYFFVPALALGVPVALWMAGAGAASIHAQVWWLANSSNHHDGPVWFWLKNTSLLVPAMAVAFFWRRALPGRLALFLAPIWLWFVVPNFLIFQPWDWDNTKFFAYWLLFGSLAVGGLLRALVDFRPEGPVLAGGLAVLLMLSGTLDLVRALDLPGAPTPDPASASAIWTDNGGLQVAAWARANTAPDAIFLVAPDHNSPIPTLGGRAVMCGYPGWMWTYGLSDWGSRSYDAQRMLKGDPGTVELLHRYRVSYVLIGPQELGIGASQAYFQENASPVYSNDGYTVYRVR